MSTLKAEAWTTPWSPDFHRVIADIPVVNGKGTVRFVDFGEGHIVVPADYSRLDELHTSTAGRLIRVYDGDTIIQEFLAERVENQVDDTTTVTVSGAGIESMFDKTIVYPYDYPTNKFLDHVWGGPNILQNEGFEEVQNVPRTYRLVIDATAGNFTLSDSTDTTSNLDWNIGDGTLETEIEADISAIDDVLVTPLGDTPIGYQLLITATGGTFTISSEADTTSNLDDDITAGNLETAIEGLSDITAVSVSAVTVDGDDGFQIDLETPSTIDLSVDTTNLTGGSAVLSVSSAGEGFDIQFVTPALGVDLTVDDAGLTGTATLTLTESGEALSSMWTKSQQVSMGTPREYGTYTGFEQSSDQAHSGTYSQFINPAGINSRLDAFAGVQQLVTVKPGGLYQASVWVRPTQPGQTYRLVIRGIDEDLIARADVSPPSGVWTQVTITDIQIDGDSQVIFRFANTQLSGNPAGFYVDDAAFTEGQAEATAGDIVGDLMDDATTDHSGDTRGTILAWVDYTGFSATTDSDSVAWDDELSFTAARGMSYGQVFDRLVELGYEWTLTPKATPGATTHDLNWWNPDGAGSDIATPTVMHGTNVLSGPVVNRIPDYTAVLVEGDDGVFVEDADATALSNFGRFEKYHGDRDLASTGSLQNAADALLSLESSNRSAVKVKLVRTDTHRPLVDYSPGDTVWFRLPGLDKQQRRVRQIDWQFDGDAVTYDVTGSRVYVGEDGGWEALRLLLRRFERMQERPSSAVGLGGGGGGMAHVLIVSDSEPAQIQDKADYVVPSTNSASSLQEVFDQLSELQGNSGAWSIWMAGIFDLDADVTAPSDSWIRGLGYTASSACS